MRSQFGTYKRCLIFPPTMLLSPCVSSASKFHILHGQWLESQKREKTYLLEVSRLEPLPGASAGFTDMSSASTLSLPFSLFLSTFLHLWAGLQKHRVVRFKKHIGKKKMFRACNYGYVRKCQYSLEMHSDGGLEHRNARVCFENLFLLHNKRKMCMRQICLVELE